MCQGDRNSFGVGSVVYGLSSEQILGRDEPMKTVDGDIQKEQSKYGVQQLYNERQDKENMRSGRSQIQRSGLGKQYESISDKGGLNEPDYEAIARGIEQANRDRQERVASHYRAAQKEHERCRARSTKQN